MIGVQKLPVLRIARPWKWLVQDCVLPVNTSSVVQPMDQTVIQSLKKTVEEVTPAKNCPFRC
ncbi:hypothetical protein T05_12943 [Trichinella murrelli]|uniref:DDE-1 domain-containing protein n=1 Tax=Trichinella murrelli TaxID=144512 RepID=A0A0V0STG4_9BILA|nr:hypothetical protein T05_12943 [Trichinella murrelli]